jgi:hypothetical protein
MPSDTNISPANNPPPPDSVPPLLSPESKHKSGSRRQFFAILLSLCLALFLIDAVVSLVDDSLILFFGLHVFSVIRGLVAILALLMAVGLYGLMGLTPMVPKRLFLPIPLFCLVVMLAVFPIMIYCFGRIQQFAWGFSAGQVVLALGILCWAQGGPRLRWPLVSVDQLGVRRFGWWNLSGFVLVNAFGLLPVVMVYLYLCATMAVDHFSEGFMTLRPNGFSVQVRKYVRTDGKTILLIPMAHVAEADFYRKVSQSFPSNSIILMEGVTDRQHLITTGTSYKRMAKALHMAEQHEEFKPSRGEMVRADVDVEQFSTNTIDFINLVMFIHSKGMTPETVQKALQYSPPPDFQKQVFGDLLRKRNRHLLEEIHARLQQSDNIMVPWGVAHMPGIAKEIQKSGFKLDETREYTLIRFHGFRK